MRLMYHVFVFTLPFCAMAKLGLFGNFDSNLTLFPFLILSITFLLDGSILNVFFRRSPEAVLLRTISLLFLLAAVLTVFHGAFLSAQGVSAYGTDPFRKSMMTSIVPIFLTLLICVSVVVGGRLPTQILQRNVEVAFVIFISYTVLQVVSAFYPNPLYEAFWPIFEGSRDSYGMPYFERFRRINGTTMEPAEFSKLLCVFFLPWFVYPAVGGIRIKSLLIVFFLGFASLALTGVLLMVVAFILIVFSRRVSGNGRFILIFMGLLASVPLMFVGDVLFAQVLARLTNLGADPSAMIRFFYNLTAAHLVLENPFLGIGWSNEIYYFPERVSEISFLWEVRNDLEVGNALTAKSLLLRLSMYLGIPLMLVLIGSIFLFLRKARGVIPDRDVARTRMTFVLLGVSAIIDGGILTSFYMWSAPALCLGVMVCRRRFILSDKVIGYKRHDETPNMAYPAE